MTYEEIYNYIFPYKGIDSPNRLGCKQIKLPGADYHTDHVSNGILYASQDAEFVAQASDAAKRFYERYHGGVVPVDPDFEEEIYPSKFGDIRIIKEYSPWMSGTVMFFSFEMECTDNLSKCDKLWQRDSLHTQ